MRFRVEPFDGGVTLTFSEPTDISSDDIRSRLSDIVRGVQRSADGTRLSITFDQPYRVRHFISGNANGIDILGTKAKPVAEPPKAATPKATIPAPTPKPKPERPKPLALQTQPLPEVEPEPEVVEMVAEPVEQVIEAIPEPVAEKTAVPIVEEVVEVTSEPEAVIEELVEQAGPTIPAPAEAIAEEIIPQAEPMPAVAEVMQVAAQEVDDTTKEAVAPATQPDAEEAPQPTPAPEPAPAPEATPEPTKPTIEPKQSMPLSSSGLGTPTDAQTAANNYEPEPAPASLTTAPSVEQAETDSGDGSFLVTTYSLPTGTEIRFPWVSRVGAAAFMRDDILWIIFNEERRINMTLLQSILPASVLAVDQIPLDGHTALRLQTDGTIYPKVSKPKNSAQWWVTLSIYKQMPARPIAIERKTAGTRTPHIYVPTLQYGEPVTLNDPMIGDEMMVVPYFNAGEGVYPAREFPELTLLNSAQGLAAVKKDDFAEIRSLRNGFRITSRDGLSLSDDLPELALAELESFGQSVTWYPYDNWRVEQGQFFDVRRELERQLQDAADVRANSLRLKLAQLYLGEGLATEALAWLEIIQSKDPFFFQDRKLEALRGAAHFLNDDYARAKRSFMQEELEDNGERDLWLEALAVFEAERPRFDYMDYFPTYISKYPPKMREKLGIVAADNYINRRSFSRALKTLDTLSLTGVQDTTMPYVNFLLGKIASENDNIDGAKQMWEPLIEADSNRFVRATAQFALTTMLYNKGEIDRAEATARLDRLRVVWRGDGLEMALLNYLGQLYVDDDNYLEALRVWQDLVQNFPDAESAITTARKMAETFNTLFAEGGADVMSPLEALSTFYEFRQLPPIGEAGDVMIQALADRLITVDLLDRAAGLLEHQIKFRQEKLARSKLGSKLALVYLLNQNPKRALEVLELTGYGQMPDDLSLKRKQLAALAMMENDEPQRAIAMLSDDASRDADKLRLQIYWRMRNWPDAIMMGERLLGSRPDVTAPLSTAETEQLLQLSIAYMFERDRNQLEYLRNYFEPLLPDGPNKEIFQFVTNPGAPLDPQQFDVVSGQIARMENFMQNYRNQISEGGLSSLLN
jgi:tetratricopeptide (TPR) repeat protein